MKLSSNAFAPNQTIPEKYTCVGDNISPPLLITESPAQAKTLALIVTDPDAPAGEWVHWLVWNIPAGVSEIEENKVPAGAAEGLTSFEQRGYGGPCPPSGVHRYIFTLYALNSVIDLPETAARSEFERAMKGHIVDQAQLIGLFGAR